MESIKQSEVVFNPHEVGLNYIEQLQIASLNLCLSERTPYLVGVNENEQKTLLTKSACKTWGCESCAARNARAWIARIILGCNAQDCAWSFLTLTAHEKSRMEKSVANLRAGWKKIYNRILATLGKTARDLFFCRVWEQHFDGTFHLHVLLNYCLGTRWAKNNARQCGMGYQAKWETVENIGMVAGYIAKYSLKNSSLSRGSVKWPVGLRRIETSRNWPKLPPKTDFSGYGWAIVQTREFQLEKAGHYELRGYEVIDLTQDKQSAAD